MTDLDDLRRAGHSTTGRAWLTNPARRALLAIGRPYFQRILEALGACAPLAAMRESSGQFAARIAALEARMTELAQGGAGLDHRVADIDRRVEALAARIGALDQAAETLDRRFDVQAHEAGTLAQAQQGMDARCAVLEARVAGIDRQIEDLAARPQPDPQAGQQRIDTARQLDGLRMDQMALNHRLGALEDQIDAVAPAPGA